MSIIIANLIPYFTKVNPTRNGPLNMNKKTLVFLWVNKILSSDPFKLFPCSSKSFFYETNSSITYFSFWGSKASFLKPDFLTSGSWYFLIESILISKFLKILSLRQLNKYFRVAKSLWSIWNLPSALI